MLTGIVARLALAPRAFVVVSETNVRELHPELKRDDRVCGLVFRRVWYGLAYEKFSVRGGRTCIVSYRKAASCTITSQKWTRRRARSSKRSTRP